MKKFIVIFTLVFAGACTLEPDFQRPEMLLENQKSFLNNIGDNGLEETGKWWTRLNDKKSEELVDMLLSQNLDIEAAYARLRQSIESSRIAGADLYPSLSAEFSGGRTDTIIANQNDNFEIGLSTAWQLDLFGRTRSDLQGRRAEVEANIFEIDALTQSLIAKTISQRVAIAINAGKLKLVEETVSNREKTLNIVERRYRAGTENADALDVRLARENLSAAKAELPIAKANLQESVYELDILLGQTPGEIEDIKYEDFPLLPPPEKIRSFPPAALLDRRPDLRAAELRLVAANADIGIALANLYPDLRITGNYGSSADKISDLLESSQIGWSLLGSITQKIFEGGRLRANIRLSEARLDELIAGYKKDVLTAVKEVEIGLLREEKLAEQVTMLTDNLREISQAEKIARERYALGIGNILELLDTQRRLWQAGQNLLNAQQANWDNRISLYLALGGDWNFYEDDLNNDSIIKGIDNEKDE